MAEIFELPDLGEGLQEAEIVAWHVGIGDHVVTDQPLVSVETDKAVVEVPSPHSGRIAALHGAPGDVVAVGAALVEFAAEAAADKGAIVGKVEAAGEEAAPTEKAKAAPAVRRLAAQLGVELAAVKPTGPRGTVTKADVERAAGEGARSEPIRGVRRAMFTT